MMGNFSFHEKKSLVLIVVISMSEAFNSEAFNSVAFYLSLWIQNQVSRESARAGIFLMLRERELFKMMKNCYR